MATRLSRFTPSARPLLKVCCIQSRAEASAAVRLGAGALGLVSEMPSGPGVIDEATIAAVAASAPPDVLTVLLTSAQDPETIARQVERTGARAAQIVDAVEPATHRELRRAAPELVIIQVVHVTGPASLDEALDVGARPEVDAILLDSGNPLAAVKELGGTGRLHDWTVSARICREAAVPVLLAGGLRPDNVRAAVDHVRPFGLDVCSGVRTGGALDTAKLGAFVAALDPGATH